MSNIDLKVYDEHICLPDNQRLPVDKQGNIIRTVRQNLLLSELAERWEFSNAQMEFYPADEVYLGQVLRAVYYLEKVSGWRDILLLVREQLIDEDRKFRPSIPYLKNLCLAAIKIRTRLDKVGISIDSYDEPDLPTPREKWLSRLSVDELETLIDAHKITRNEYDRELKYRRQIQADNEYARELELKHRRQTQTAQSKPSNNRRVRL